MVTEGLFFRINRGDAVCEPFILRGDGLCSVFLPLRLAGQTNTRTLGVRLWHRNSEGTHSIQSSLSGCLVPVTF